MAEATRPTLVRRRPRALKKAFLAAYGPLFDGEFAAFIERLETHEAAASNDVSLALPLVPTFATIYGDKLPPSSLDAFFRGLHPVWFEAGDPAYVTAIALGAPGPKKPVYEIDNDTLETVRVASSLDEWLGGRSGHGRELPPHADPVTLGARAEWLCAMLSGRVFDVDELAHVPKLRVYAKEKAHVTQFPHLAAYWPLHHALLKNPVAFADAATRAAVCPHPLVAEFLIVAKKLMAGKPPGQGLDAFATFWTNYGDLVPKDAVEAKTRTRADEPFPGYRELHRYNVENIGILMHNLGPRQLEFIDDWAATLVAKATKDTVAKVEAALVQSLAYRSEQGEPLAMVGLLTGWAALAKSFDELIAPLQAMLEKPASVPRWQELLRCAARFDSPAAHALILEGARRWAKAFARKSSDAYFEPQEEGWLSLFFTESPLRSDLARLLVGTPLVGFAQLFADEHPSLVDDTLHKQLAGRDPLTPAKRKALLESLSVAAPTAALRKRPRP